MVLGLRSTIVFGLDSFWLDRCFDRAGTLPVEPLTGIR